MQSINNKMKNIQVDPIAKRVVVLRNKSGQWTINITSEQAKHFLVSIDTDKNFDEMAVPEFKLVKNGKTSIIVDTEPREVYDLMIKSANNESFSVVYEETTAPQQSSQPVPSPQQAPELDDDTRKQIFADLEKISLPENYMRMLNEYIAYIANLYMTSKQHEADIVLVNLYKISKNGVQSLTEYINILFDNKPSTVQTAPTKPSATPQSEPSPKQKEKSSDGFFDMIFSGKGLICILVIVIIIVFVMQNSKNGGMSVPSIFSI